LFYSPHVFTAPIRGDPSPRQNFRTGFSSLKPRMMGYRWWKEFRRYATPFRYNAGSWQTDITG